MNSLTADVRSTYDANKRELFEAMRAYHTSEIAHKRDAIGLLTTLLAAIGAVFAAILVPARPIPHAGPLAAVLAAVACGLAAVIVWSTNAKIKADHDSYEKLGAEYVRQCQRLGLYDEADVDGKKQSIKLNRKIGEGVGYKHTQRIVWSVGVAIGALALFGAVFINLTETKGPAGSPTSGGPLRADSSAATQRPELWALPPAESLGTARGR